MILLIQKNPDQANPSRQKVDKWFCRGFGAGEWGVTANRYGVFFGDDGNNLELDSGKWLHNLVTTLKTTKLYTLKG